MRTRTQQTARALPGGRVPNAITYGIRPDPTAAQLSDLFAFILGTERMERNLDRWLSSRLTNRGRDNA